jgi:hypothetical protein
MFSANAHDMDMAWHVACACFAMFAMGIAWMGSAHIASLHFSLLYVTVLYFSTSLDAPCSWCTTARRTSRRRHSSVPRRRRALRRARARWRSARGYLWRAPPSLGRARRMLAKGAGLSRTSPCRPPRCHRSPRPPSASALRSGNVDAWTRRQDGGRAEVVGG